MLLELGILLAILSLILGYIDSTFGMGYGTTISPILLLIGFEPLQIVPAVLLAELIAGFFAAGMHHCLGNVNFAKDSVHLKLAFLLGICSIGGAVAAVLVATNIPVFYLKLYIGVLVLAMGLLILLKRNSKKPFSWKKIAGFGLLAAFNKGMSGGGYGPLVVSGQILSGLNGKNAIGVSALAEGITCLAAVTFYFLASIPIDWQLAPYLVIGAVVSVPFSAFTLKIIKEENVVTIVGLVSILLGIFTTGKILSFF